MKRWICVLIAVVMLIMAIPGADCLASQDVWSAFLTTDCTDADSLSAFFKKQFKSMQSEWKSERKEAEQDNELLSRRVQNAILKAQIDMLQTEITQLNGKISDNESEIVRINALLSVGDATKSDIDALEDEKAVLEKDLDAAQKDLGKAQTAMADMDEYRESDEGWDTYTLDEDTDFWNGGLELLTDYALLNSAEYLDALNSEQEALWTLWMDYTLRRAEGQDVPDEFFGLEIASGEKVDPDDLRDEYDKFLVDIGVLDPSELENDEDEEETDADEAGGMTEEEQLSQSGFILPFPTEDDETEISDDDIPEQPLPEIAPVEQASGTGGPGDVPERPEVSTEAPGSSDEADESGEEQEDDGEEEEDDQDSLYNALLDYQDKAFARMDLEDTLTDNIEKDYDALSADWDDYVSLTEKAGVPRDVALKLNRVSFRVGEKTKDDYEGVIEEYETLETDLAEAEYQYLSDLYGMDLLTGGGMSYLCANPELTEQAPVLEDAEDPDSLSQFSIVTYTKDEPLENTFTFGVEVPKKMQSEISQYELWGGSGRIGSPMLPDALISSPVLDQGDLGYMWIRFLRDGEYVGQCEIDPYVPMGQVSAKIKLKKTEEK